MQRIVFIFFLAFLFVLGCKRTNESDFPSCGSSHSEDNSHEGHDHGDVSSIKESYTIFTDDYELFVEFDPLVVGKVSSFLAHFTKLDTYKPVTSGNLTLSLVSGEKGVRQKSENPSSPGIFNPSLKPLNSGNAYLLFELNVEGAAYKFKIENVKVYENSETAMIETEAKDTLDGISFLKEQAWKIDFETQDIRYKPFKKIIKASGKILPAQGDEIIVAAKNPGTVFLTNRNIIPGKFVNNGQLLVVVSDSDITEENIDFRYTNSKSQYEKAKADFERAEKLIKDQIISQKEYLDYKLQYDQAKSNFDLIASRYSSNGIKVFASTSGYIKNVYVNEGEHLETGDPIVSISKNKRLKIVAEVSQQYFHELQYIESANFKIPANNRTYSTDSLNGRLISYGKSISDDEHLIPLYFEIDNVGDMVSGAYLEIFLKSSSKSKSLVVPNNALMEHQGKYFVYVQLAGELYEKRYIKLGGTDGYYTEVISGLKQGERIVTEGAYRVKLASSASAMPSGHAGHVH